MILITGGNGFIGTHIYNFLKYVIGEREIISIGKTSFNNNEELKALLKKATYIIHLAGVNRDEKEAFVYKENRRICNYLISELKNQNLYPRFINISSIHEESDTAFGRAKKENRIDLEKYYQDQPYKLVSFLTPNIFGPFCKPNYNSFVATFCYNIINQNPITLNNDRTIELLYIDELVNQIHYHLDSNTGGMVNSFETTSITISDVLGKLENFKNLYLNKGIIPNLNSAFNVNLFNTFRSYIPPDHFPKSQLMHSDYRGYFAEIIRSTSEGQVSISTSSPSVERGNHFHTRKIERFQIIKGKALVELRKVNTEEIIRYELCSEKLDYVDIPIWYTHNLINKSNNDDLIMLFWISEHYSEESHDTYPLNVRL